MVFKLARHYSTPPSAFGELVHQVLLKDSIVSAQSEELLSHVHVTMPVDLRRSGNEFNPKCARPAL